MAVQVTAQQTRWLSEDEQQSWRAWLLANLLINERLERDFREHGLTGAEYEVMVRLSDSGERRLRMSELAGRLSFSKSRLSHVVARMEADGLVERHECSEDRRGQWCVLTERGWQRLVEVAPHHVESVRSSLLDPLTAEEFAELGRLCAKVARSLGDEG